MVATTATGRPGGETAPVPARCSRRPSEAHGVGPMGTLLHRVGTVARAASGPEHHRPGDAHVVGPMPVLQHRIWHGLREHVRHLHVTLPPVVARPASPWNIQSGRTTRSSTLRPELLEGVAEPGRPRCGHGDLPDRNPPGPAAPGPAAITARPRGSSSNPGWQGTPHRRARPVRIRPRASG